MTNMTRKIASAATLALLAGLATASGCATTYDASVDSPQAAQEVTEDERVEVRVLLASELANYAKDKLWTAEEKADYNARITQEFGGQKMGVELLAGLAIDFLFDAAKSAVAAEAAKHERQWGGIVYAEGYWKRDSKTSQLTQNIAGFEVVRYARDFNDPKKLVAARMVFGFKANAADPRLFTIHPLAVEVNGTKAKVSASKVNLKIDIGIQATWIDRAQTAHVAKVSQTSYEVSGYPLNTTPVLIKELKEQVAGWYAGIPVSQAPDGTLIGDGVFSITVNVTETDPSKAKETIEKFGRLIESGRDPAKEALK